MIGFAYRVTPIFIYPFISLLFNMLFSLNIAHILFYKWYRGYKNCFSLLPP